MYVCISYLDFKSVVSHCCLKFYNKVYSSDWGLADALVYSIVPQRSSPLHMIPLVWHYTKHSRSTLIVLLVACLRFYQNQNFLVIEFQLGDVYLYVGVHCWYFFFFSGYFFSIQFCCNKYMECIQTSNALFEFCLMFFGGLLATAGCQHFFITLKWHVVVKMF